MNLNSLILFLLILIAGCNNKIEKDKPILTQVIPKQAIDTVIIKEVIENYTKDFILGKFNYKKDTSFTKVATIHSSKSLYLNKEVYNAFKKMHDAAKKEKINLKIISGTRSFKEQKYIWERKWEKYKNLPPIKRALKILEFSSMPSTSRHHWGTDMDLNNLNNSYFEKSQGKKEYEWLLKNGNSYGFYQVYTTKNNGRTGYNLEKWHWSYLPLANKYLKFYNQNINYNDISEFKGAELANKITVIEAYVNGISKKAKNFIE